MGVKASRIEETKRQLRTFTTQLKEEKLCYTVLYVACFPLMQRIKQNLRPHKVTGLTALDITIVKLPVVEPGVVRVAIGATGGKGGRGYIVRFVELGTAHNRAYPFMRPAWDSEQRFILRRIAAAYRARVGPNGFRQMET